MPTPGGRGKQRLVDQNWASKVWILWHSALFCARGRRLQLASPPPPRGLLSNGVGAG